MSLAGRDGYGVRTGVDGCPGDEDVEVEVSRHGEAGKELVAVAELEEPGYPLAVVEIDRVTGSDSLGDPPAGTVASPLLLQSRARLRLA